MYWKEGHVMVFLHSLFHYSLERGDSPLMGVLASSTVVSHFPRNIFIFQLLHELNKSSEEKRM